jgi:hypothetical protein
MVHLRLDGRKRFGPISAGNSACGKSGMGHGHATGVHCGGCRRTKIYKYALTVKPDTFAKQQRLKWRKLHDPLYAKFEDGKKLVQDGRFTGTIRMTKGGLVIGQLRAAEGADLRDILL